MLRTSTILLFVCFLVMDSGCKKKGGSDSQPSNPSGEFEFESKLISGGSRAVASPIPPKTRNSNSPEVSITRIKDSIFQPGSTLQFETQFEDPNGDVTEVYAHVNGDPGYVVFPVEGAGGIKNGFIDINITIRSSSDPDRYVILIAIVDAEGNVSSHVSINLTITRGDSDFELIGCVAGSDPPNIRGIWNFTHTIVEVPSGIGEVLIGNKIQEQIKISGFRDLSFEYPQLEGIMIPNQGFGRKCG